MRCFLYILFAIVICSSGCAGRSSENDIVNATVVSETTSGQSMAQGDSLFVKNNIGGSAIKEDEESMLDDPVVKFVLGVLLVVLVACLIILLYVVAEILFKLLLEKAKKENVNKTETQQINSVLKQSKREDNPKEKKDDNIQVKSNRETTIYSSCASAKPIKKFNDDKQKLDSLAKQKKPKEKVRNYQLLTVYNKALEIADEYQTIYYQMWDDDGKFYFEFVNNERTPMAINNRSFIIEPFCDIDESSRTPDESKRIETKKPGLLNTDLSLNKKAVIKYL